MEGTIHGHLATRTAGTQLGVWWGGGGLHSEDPASVERPRRRPQARHPRHVFWLAGPGRWRAWNPLESWFWILDERLRSLE